MHFNNIGYFNSRNLLVTVYTSTARPTQSLGKLPLLRREQKSLPAQVNTKCQAFCDPSQSAAAARPYILSLSFD